ncbi:MAG: hypothetical protein IPL49_03295 [Saprospirales bacterium]|nr:hypothetical protein [Saprospirales bacterium]
MQTRSILPFFPLAVLFLVLSCGCRESSLEAYYYPLDELREGLVYEYRSAGDTLDPPFYWYYRTLEQDGATFLTGMYYDQNFTPYQFTREEKVANGMLLVDYYLYENDSTGKQVQIPVEIEGGNLFSFEAPDPNTVLFYKIRFSTPSDPTTVNSLVRNRQFRSDTTYTYGGKTYDAAVFYVRELIDIEDEGHVEHEFDGLEIYAKGLGMVYFRKNVTESFITEYKLADRYTMEAFEKKFKPKLEEGD